MKMKMHGVILFLLFCEFHGQPYPDASQDSHQETKTIKIGLILDSKSWLGKVVNSCMSMAISDFYTLNGQYKTRIALETRDLRGEPLNFLAAGELFYCCTYLFSCVNALYVYSEESGW